jgi:DNA-binding NtrC family response regulator
MSVRPRVLVVDDDKAVRAALTVNLGKRDMDVSAVENPTLALAALTASSFDLVLTDVKMPGTSGLDLLEKIRATWPDLPVIVMTGYGSVKDAVHAMKVGASDYLIKPVERDELMVVVDRALEGRAIRAELAQLRQEVQQRYGFENLIGATAVMLRLYEEIAAVADSNATVLLEGPTGTGKELLAHALHYRSRRASKSFVRVNCGALPASLLESELFGHERGAFSGAIRQHRGTFERADGGTLLLDEIGEIDLPMQVKLLRVLENGEFQRVGGSETLTVDVRVVAATNRDLRDEVRAGRFREDLYYRLNVVRLKVPPLRDRADDIPLLVNHFVRRVAEREGRRVPSVMPDDLERLKRYPWPGNVRQLQHVVERAVILSRGDTLDFALPDDEGEDRLPAATQAAPVTPPELPLVEALLRYERNLIIAALEAEGGVQARAARRLGVSRSNLNYRIQRLGITLAGVSYS